MRSKFRSTDFKSILMITLGVILILFQSPMLLTINVQDYGSGVTAPFTFIGTWIFIIVGVICLIFGIISKRKCQLNKGANAVLTIAFGTTTLAIMTVFTALMSISQRNRLINQDPNGLFSVITIMMRLSNITVVFAMLSCGSISMAVVALAFPYWNIIMNPSIYLNLGSQELMPLYVATLFEEFVAPCVWAIIVNAFSRNGGWKRFLVGLLVGYGDMRVATACFNNLGILLTPSLRNHTVLDIGGLVIISICTVGITILIRFFLSKYDRKHGMKIEI